MSYTVDMRPALAQVDAIPALTLGNADRLDADYELSIDGPDADGFVWVSATDPETGDISARNASLYGDAEAWLAWRDSRDG